VEGGVDAGGHRFGAGKERAEEGGDFTGDGGWLAEEAGVRDAEKRVGAGGGLGEGFVPVAREAGVAFGEGLEGAFGVKGAEHFFLRGSDLGDVAVDPEHAAGGVRGDVGELAGDDLDGVAGGFAEAAGVLGEGFDGFPLEEAAGVVGVGWAESVGLGGEASGGEHLHEQGGAGAG
jgi:hypothetical protein